MMHRAPAVALALAALAPLAATSAEQPYPVRPIRLLIPYSPGGASDNVARLVMPRVSEALGQSVVIDNRPGGAGVLGREIAARAAPDGYTLITLDAPHAIMPHVMRKLPFDPLKDYTLITPMATSPMIIVVNASFPARTLKELIAIARAQPGKLNFGSGGTGATTHLTGEMFRQAAKIDIVHVPYKSIAPAVTDVIGNQVQIAFPGFATVGGHILSGRVRALAVASTKRSAAFPDVPTFEEAGAPGVHAANWFGVAGPAGLPPAITSRLLAEIHKSVRSPDTQERFGSLGIETMLMTPAEFRAMIVTEMDRWGKVVKASGLKPE